MNQAQKIIKREINIERDQGILVGLETLIHSRSQTVYVEEEDDSNEIIRYNPHHSPALHRYEMPDTYHHGRYWYRPPPPSTHHAYQHHFQQQAEFKQGQQQQQQHQQQ
jgi:hypothetical protein